MKFWMLEYNKYFYSAGQVGLVEINDKSLGERLLPKQFKEDLARAPFGRYELTDDIKPYRVPISRSWTRRFRAKFGGFFSFPSTTTGQEGTFINGASFFSIVGRRGWSFVSFDQHPWDIQRLNAELEAVRAQYYLKTMIGSFYTFHMFDKAPINSHFSQANLYNFSPAFSKYHGSRFFLPRQFRDAEAFRLFYENGRLEPALRLSPELLFSSSKDVEQSSHYTSIVFDTRQYLMAHFAHLFAFKKLAKFRHPRVIKPKALVSMPYEELGDMMRAAGNEAVLQKKLSFDFDNFFPINFSSDGINYGRYNGLRNTKHTLSVARKILCDFSYPTPAYFFGEVTEILEFLRTIKTRYRFKPGHYRNSFIERFSHLKMRSEFIRKQLARYSMPGGRFFTRGVIHTRWRSFIRYAYRNLTRKTSSSAALAFLLNRARVSALDAGGGALGPKLRAITHYRFVRRISFNRRSWRRRRVEHITRWLLPNKNLIGRRNRKRQLSR